MFNSLLACFNTSLASTSSVSLSDEAVYDSLLGLYLSKETRSDLAGLISVTKYKTTFLIMKW